MRRDGDEPYAMEFSALEREVLAEMQQMTGCTRANLIRSALWHYAEFLEMRIDIRAGVFDERHGTGQYRRKAKQKVAS